MEYEVCSPNNGLWECVSTVAETVRRLGTMRHDKLMVMESLWNQLINGHIVPARSDACTLHADRQSDQLIVQVGVTTVVGGGWEGDEHRPDRGCCAALKTRNTSSTVIRRDTLPIFFVPWWDACNTERGSCFPVTIDEYMCNTMTRETQLHTMCAQKEGKKIIPLSQVSRCRLQRPDHADYTNVSCTLSSIKCQKWVRGHSVIVSSISSACKLQI